MVVDYWSWSHKNGLLVTIFYFKPNFIFPIPSYNNISILNILSKCITTYTNFKNICIFCIIDIFCGLHYFVRKILLENVRNFLLENFRNNLLEIVPRKSHLVENVRNLLEFVRNYQEGWKMSEICWILSEMTINTI